MSFGAGAFGVFFLVDIVNCNDFDVASYYCGGVDKAVMVLLKQQQQVSDVVVQPTKVRVGGSWKNIKMSAFVFVVCSCPVQPQQ